MHENWDAQLDGLVNAYLELLASSPASRVPPYRPPPEQPVINEINLASNRVGSAHIQLLDLYGASM